MFGPHALVQDNSSAAANAAKKIWDPFDYGMCAVHAMKIWLETHKANTPENSAIFSADFEKFKNCPILGLVTSGVFLKKLLTKWREI